PTIIDSEGQRGKERMSLRTRVLALSLATAAVAVAAGLAFSVGSGVNAQAPAPTPAASLGGPAGVPSARFFGSVSGAAGAPVVSGTSVTASINGVACGTGTVTGTTYVVDVQSIAGCTTPGA